jgi:hypothetical protein
MVGKSSPKICAISVNFKKLSKVNKWPIGEMLVTLLTGTICLKTIGNQPSIA